MHQNRVFKPISAHTCTIEPSWHQRYTHSDLFQPNNHMQIRKPKMNDTRKERFTYISFTGQKRYSHARLQISTIHQWEANSSCTFTLMAEGDKAEFHIVQRQREFTLKICRAISEKSEKSRPENNYKNCLYSSGITKIFSSEVTPQLPSLSLEKTWRRSDLNTNLGTMKSNPFCQNRALRRHKWCH